MRPRLALAALALTLSSCNASDGADDVFSLTVTVVDDSGRPVADQDVYLRFDGGDGRPAGRAGGGDLFVAPNPWGPSMVVRLNVGAASDVRIGLLDVEGDVRKTLADGPLAAGAYTFSVEATDGAGADLPGGVYTVRAVVGADTLRATTAHSDLFNADVVGVLYCRLGRTGADGTVTVTDRTAVPAFYDVDEIEVTDESGNPLGDVRFTRSAEVVVISEDGDEEAEPVRLDDGPNAVEVRL